jgi:hypothetical protein
MFLKRLILLGFFHTALAGNDLYASSGSRSDHFCIDMPCVDSAKSFWSFLNGKVFFIGLFIGSALNFLFSLDTRDLCISSEQAKIFGLVGLFSLFYFLQDFVMRSSSCNFSQRQRESSDHVAIDIENPLVCASGYSLDNGIGDELPSEGTGFVRLPYGIEAGFCYETSDSPPKSNSVSYPVSDRSEDSRERNQSPLDCDSYLDAAVPQVRRGLAQDYHGEAMAVSNGRSENSRDRSQSPLVDYSYVCPPSQVCRGLAQDYHVADGRLDAMNSRESYEGSHVMFCRGEKSPIESEE